jgi:hypothetical protein
MATKEEMNAISETNLFHEFRAKMQATYIEAHTQMLGTSGGAWTKTDMDALDDLTLHISDVMGRRSLKLAELNATVSQPLPRTALGKLVFSADPSFSASRSLSKSHPNDRMHPDATEWLTYIKAGQWMDTKGNVWGEMSGGFGIIMSRAVYIKSIANDIAVKHNPDGPPPPSLKDKQALLSAMRSPLTLSGVTYPRYYKGHHLRKTLTRKWESADLVTKFFETVFGDLIPWTDEHEKALSDAKELDMAKRGQDMRAAEREIFKAKVAALTTTGTDTLAEQQAKAYEVAKAEVRQQWAESVEAEARQRAIVAENDAAIAAKEHEDAMFEAREDALADLQAEEKAEQQDEQAKQAADAMFR